MKRRTALRTLAAAAGVAATPAWIARAFGQSGPRRGFSSAAAALHDAMRPPPPALPSPELLRQARARAEALGKPLLVLVVPADASERFRRGQAFGELINHGGDERLALLALCEVVCATDDAVRAVAPELDAREPLMVLLERDAATGRASATALEGSLPQVVARSFREDFARQQREEDRIIDQRIEFLGALLRHGLAPDDATLARRVARARARHSPELLAQVDGAVAQLRARALAPGTADAGAAVLFAAAQRARGEARDALYDALARAAAARLRNQRVPGGRWARATGCGTFIEDERELGGVGCGMGHVAARSQRFLDFYVAEGPRQR